MNFKDNLKKLMGKVEIKNFNQLSKKSGISRPTIDHWFKCDKPIISSQKLILLRRALNCSYSDILKPLVS
jgi:DNA-binding Xre family transcriptional regulator